MRSNNETYPVFVPAQLFKRNKLYTTQSWIDEASLARIFYYFLEKNRTLKGLEPIRVWKLDDKYIIGDGNHRTALAIYHGTLSLIMAIEHDQPLPAYYSFSNLYRQCLPVFYKLEQS